MFEGMGAALVLGAITSIGGAMTYLFTREGRHVDQTSKRYQEAMQYIAILRDETKDDVIRGLARRRLEDLYVTPEMIDFAVKGEGDFPKEVFGPIYKVGSDKKLFLILFVSWITLIVGFVMMAVK